jgi:hypothetical protein
MLDLILTLVLVGAVIALTPFLIWAMQGLKPKNGGGALGAVLDGFAVGYEARQEHLQNAKRKKQQGGRESGDPPSLEG